MCAQQRQPAQRQQLIIDSVQHVERIWKLTQLRDQMGGCIGCRCRWMKDCPLRNPGDALSECRQGAVLLEGEPVRQRKPT